MVTESAMIYSYLALWHPNAEGSNLRFSLEYSYGGVTIPPPVNKIAVKMKLMAGRKFRKLNSGYQPQCCSRIITMKRSDCVGGEEMGNLHWMQPHSDPRLSVGRPVTT
jgi:hypothetical protein